MILTPLELRRFSMKTRLSAPPAKWKMKLHFTSFLIAQKQHLWNQLKEYITNKTLVIPLLAPQSTFLGFDKFTDDY